MADPDGPDLCLGIDIGGTFTDAVLTGRGRIWRAKVPTTPDDLGDGVVEACRLVAARSGHTLGSLLPRVSRFGLGTTAVTNTLAARTGRRVGLITTKGFEDLVTLARGRRVNENGWLVMPPQLVDRRCIVGVDERIDRHGTVLVPLRRDDVLTAASRLVDECGVEAIAVSFLWSFRNPSHEEQAVAALTDAYPELPVTSGAALNPVIREFERSTFAVLNAYVSGALVGVDRLADRLAQLGLRVPLLLVHSGGGTTTVAEAHQVPISLAESGPAAGVAAAGEIARASGIADAVTCDMGGTSFDVSVIDAGDAIRRGRGELMGVWTALSLVDVDSIGAGGGSIAWIDARRMLRVGPQSAGAVPGPVCYGRGGTEPTVTDALLVLGFLAPDRFLGGTMPLDVGAARDACARLGERLSLSAEELAWGIREIALAGMAKAVRGRLAERGLDPRGRALITYGGCGALFAADIARAINIGTVVVPALASVLSAFGAATADVRRERVQALELPFPVEVELVAMVAEKLRAHVDADLAADGIEVARRSVSFELDLRFRRQKWELTIPLRGDRIDAQSLDRAIDDFRAEYARRYGEGALMAGAVVELVGIRAVGTGRTVKADLAGLAEAAEAAEAAAAITPAEPAGVARGTRARAVERSGAAGKAGEVPDRGDGATTASPTLHRRAVWLSRSGDPVPIEVFSGPELRAGDRIAGPAIVDGVDTTIWVPRGATLAVDERRTAFILV